MASRITNDKDIYLTRGDSFKAVISIEDSEHQTYVPEQGDVIRFAMKKGYNDRDTLIEKQIPIDTMLLEIDPEDTKPLAFGVYVYDIEITMNDGTVDTFIPTAKFTVMEEVE